MKMPNVVERQIENIYSELAIQMKRMAQLQVQIDSLHSAVRKLTAKAE
jgi:polyhydroxyalkanoate synthesis regulator phasin